MDELVIGIDYGEKNIGLAIGRNGLVNPLTIVDATDENAAIHTINRYMMENKVTKAIMGLPLTAGGKENNQSKIVRKFAKIFKIRTKKQVEFINEFRTTKDLKTADIGLGLKKAKYGKVDHFSAALILKDYFSSLD